MMAASGQPPGEIESCRAAEITAAVARALADAGIGRDVPVLAGVSGGMDSMVMLEILREIGQARVVVHVDHGLRGEASDEDARLVAAAAVPAVCEVVRRDVGARAGREKISLETAGRLSRREVFAEVAVRMGLRHLILAHHADDQAETVLWNLCRGCGLGGVAGMAEVETQKFPGGCELVVVRPLLGLRRRDVAAFAGARGVVWREDASNGDAAFTRNRFRLRVMPVLEEAAGRDVVEALTRFARVAGEDDAVLAAWAGEACERLARETGTLELAGFRALAGGMQNRVLMVWLASSGIPAVDSGTLGRVRAMARGSARPARVNLPGGRYAVRRAGRLRLE